MWNGTMFVDLDWPLNTSSLLSASAELLVIITTTIIIIIRGWREGMCGDWRDKFQAIPEIHQQWCKCILTV